MNWRSPTRRRLGLGAGLVVAAGTIALGCAMSLIAPVGDGAASSHHAGVSSQHPTKVRARSALPRDLVLLSAELARTSAHTAAHFDAVAPGMPTCAPPPLPAATYPPGQSYGVPFLAAVTGGELLSGYDEWTADHTDWKVKKKTYQLDPWQSKVFDITGWVAGLLQLPSLSAQVPPQDVVFCDGGGAACVSADPPAGQCIHVSLGGQPEAGLAPFPPLTNDPPPGKACQGSPSCLPYIVTLTPAGDSTLTVTGVEPNGALDLSITTSAQTTVSLTEGTTTQTCENSPTSITLSTTAPSSLPAGAPVPPTTGNPDYRSLQLPPLPLTGPLASASSTASGNDFVVPAFAYPATKTCPELGISASLNAPLAGWNTKGNSIYYSHKPAAIAGEPGWDQFTVTTTVFALDLPVGPPPTFPF